LHKNDIIIDWIKYDFGAGQRNPVDAVKFYNRYQAEGTTLKLKSAFHIPRQSVSHIVPENYAELFVRVYSKDINKQSMLQKAFLKLLENIPWAREALLNKELRISY
jgi:hypothetical protein